jgi:hypothetical protein
MRFLPRSSFLIFFVVLAACSRDEGPTVKRTDSASVTNVAPSAPTDSLRVGDTTSGSHGTGSHGTPAANAGAASSDSVHTEVLPNDDPIAKKLLEAMRGRAPGTKPTPGPVSGRNVISSTRLSELQPHIPGYAFVAQPSNFDGQGQGRSTALLKSTADPTKTLRVIIKSEDETMGSSFVQKLNELKRAGSLTDYSQGEPITAHYLQVGGQPAAKAYIPSKRVATLTVFVGEHRLVQLREDKVNSADHLLEVSKYLDIKRFAAMKSQE